jgi:SAM-dependent methyltransferase
MTGDFTQFERAGWERAASSYEGSFAAATKLFGEALLDAVGATRGTRLLDLACGTGWLSGFAVARGAEPTGADFSRAMIAEARRSHPAITFREADARDLPFETAAFGAAVMSFGIHHVAQPERALAEVLRVLRPGGRFAFTLWAKPPDNPPWNLITGAVKTHGRPQVKMPAGNDDAVQLEALLAAASATGFIEIAHERVERIWRLPADADLVAIYEAGTVRMAALLRGQSPAQLAAVREAVRRGLCDYEAGGAVMLPIRAVLVVVRKQLTR